MEYLNYEVKLLFTPAVAHWFKAHHVAASLDVLSISICQVDFTVLGLILLRSDGPHIPFGLGAFFEN